MPPLPHPIFSTVGLSGWTVIDHNSILPFSDSNSESHPIQLSIGEQKTMITINPELETLKTRLKATWMTGDYGHFATYMEPGALAFLARLAITPGTKMLDVACGAGQIAIPAAREGAEVIGVDISTN
jgi:SAM-dependent methyltransferase